MERPRSPTPSPRSVALRSLSECRSRFHELLEQLSSEHDKEVGRLSSHVRSLELKLGDAVPPLTLSVPPSPRSMEQRAGDSAVPPSQAPAPMPFFSASQDLRQAARSERSSEEIDEMRLPAEAPPSPQSHSSIANRTQERTMTGDSIKSVKSVSAKSLLPKTLLKDLRSSIETEVVDVVNAPEERPSFLCLPNALDPQDETPKIIAAGKKEEEIATSSLHASSLSAYTPHRCGGSNCTSNSAVSEKIASSVRFKSTRTLEEEEEPKFVLKEEWSKSPEAVLLSGHSQDLECVATFARAMIGDDTENDIVKQIASKRTLLTRQHTMYSAANFTVKNCFTKCQPVSPAHPARITWDIIGMMFIGWDMVVIPISIAFDPDEFWVTDIAGWITLLFWTSDMVASCCTGYYQDGRLEMKRSRIIKNYMKLWFWVDLVVVVPDWILKAMGSMTNAAGLGRIIRAARVIRVLRFLRILKLKKIFTLIYDLIDNEYMFLVFSCIKLIFIIVCMNHIVACVWYLIGRIGKESGNGRNWLEDVGDTPVWGESFSWKYLTSLHWSITQFTPASMDIWATNVAERLFSVFILFWALVALSSFIGSVSASITALRSLSNDEMQQFWILRKYLKQRNVSRDLVERLLRYLEYRSTTKQNVIDPSKVKLLNGLSEQLKLELANEMSGPLLRNHPFFDQLAEQLPVMHCRLCQSALQTHSLATEDMMFECGSEGNAMYFVKHGCFEYRLADGQALGTPLVPNYWSAEAVLWTTWNHQGYLVAKCPSETVAVLPNEFAHVFRQHARPFEFAQTYGTAFVVYINSVPMSALTDVMFDPIAWIDVLNKADKLAQEKQQIHGDKSTKDIFKSRFKCPEASGTHSGVKQIRSKSSNWEPGNSIPEDQEPTVSEGESVNGEIDYEGKSTSNVKPLAKD